jgi:hypothetical protein
MSNTVGWRKAAENLKIIGDALQPIVLVVGGIFALVTYSSAQREQQDARTRELRRPYDERQLDLYLDAARVTAHLAASPPSDPKELESLKARFWELYWGQLAFVESRVDGTGRSVETHMVEICESYVSPDKPEKCHSRSDPKLGAAIHLAYAASEEVKARWTPKSPAARPTAESASIATPPATPHTTE